MIGNHYDYSYRASRIDLPDLHLRHRATRAAACDQEAASRGQSVKTLTIGHHDEGDRDARAVEGDA